MSASFDCERLDALVAEGWLRSQRHPDADLWIYNYTERCQFEKHWTPETLACRGLILDADGAVVARPFPKFFNLHELPDFDPVEHGGFTATEKIDGSLGIVYHLDGEDFVATRGSFTSEQACEGTAMLRDYDYEYRISFDTPLLEIVYPENRIVVDYGGRRELVLLAVLQRADGYESAMGWSGPVAETHPVCCDIDELNHERPNREGYVLAFESGVRVKVKHAEYVRLHKLITGVNARHIWEILKEGGDLDSMLDGIPDELHQWITDTRTRLEGDFAIHRDRALEVFDGRPFDADRKTLAAYFMESEANPAVLFRMLDRKAYDDLIWKAIKPEPTTPDTIWSRDTTAA